ELAAELPAVAAAAEATAAATEEWNRTARMQWRNAGRSATRGDAEWTFQRCSWSSSVNQIACQSPASATPNAAIDCKSPAACQTRCPRRNATTPARTAITAQHHCISNGPDNK